MNLLTELKAERDSKYKGGCPLPAKIDRKKVKKTE